jgi:hypothetical protein
MFTRIILSIFSDNYAYKNNSNGFTKFYLILSNIIYFKLFVNASFNFLIKIKIL